MLLAQIPRPRVSDLRHVGSVAAISLSGSLVMALLVAEPQALSSIFCRVCLCLERSCDLCGALGIGPVPTFGSLIHSAEEHADIRRQPFHSALVCCADLISAAYHVQCGGQLLEAVAGAPAPIHPPGLSRRATAHVASRSIVEERRCVSVSGGREGGVQAKQP
jgi:hypothetical protein